MRLFAVNIRELDRDARTPILVREDGIATHRFTNGERSVPEIWRDYAELAFASHPIGNILVKEEGL